MKIEHLNHYHYLTSKLPPPFSTRPPNLPICLSYRPTNRLVSILPKKDSFALLVLAVAAAASANTIPMHGHRFSFSFSAGGGGGD